VRKIDIDTWERKEHFNFFMNFDDPVFGITANVDVSILKKYCKREGLSFFLASLFCSTAAVNSVENFRLRIIGKDLYLFDEIYAGSTILQDDKSFSFAYFEREKDLHMFCQKGSKTIDKQKNGGEFDPRNDDLNVIYYSVIPWINFTAIKHPVKHDPSFSIPKITFGKIVENNEKLSMPVSVEAHHSLLDGYHVGLYFENFQKKMNSFS